MNQDQARRMAEEVELPEPRQREIYATSENTESVRKGYEVGGYVKKPNMWDETQVREAIVSALVKLTQQGPVAWITKEDARDFGKGPGESAFCYTKHGRWNIPLYTHPEHIQQEDRKPLTDVITKKDAALQACVEALELGRDYTNEARDEHARTFGDHPATEAELKLFDEHKKQIDTAITQAQEAMR